MRSVGQSDYPPELRAEALFLRDRTTLSRRAIAELLPELRGEHSVSSFEKTRKSGWVPPPVPEARQQELLRAASTIEGCIIRPPAEEAQGSLLPERAPMPVHVDNDETVPSKAVLVASYMAGPIETDIDALNAETARLRQEIEELRATEAEMARQLVDQEELLEQAGEARQDAARWQARAQVAERMLWFKMQDTHDNNDETAEESD